MIQSKHLIWSASLLVLISMCFGQQAPKTNSKVDRVIEIKKCNIDTLKMDSITMYQNETQRLLKQIINK